MVLPPIISVAGGLQLVPVVTAAAEWGMSVVTFKRTIAKLEELSGRRIPIIEVDGHYWFNLHALLVAGHIASDPHTPVEHIPALVALWGGLTREVVRVELGFVGKSLFGAQQRYDLSRGPTDQTRRPPGRPKYYSPNQPRRPDGTLGPLQGSDCVVNDRRGEREFVKSARPGSKPRVGRKKCKPGGVVTGPSKHPDLPGQGTLEPQPPQSLPDATGPGVDTTDRPSGRGGVVPVYPGGPTPGDGQGGANPVSTVRGPSGDTSVQDGTGGPQGSDREDAIRTGGEARGDSPASGEFHWEGDPHDDGVSGAFWPDDGLDIGTGGDGGSDGGVTTTATPTGQPPQPGPQG